MRSALRAVRGRHLTWLTTTRLLTDGTTTHALGGHSLGGAGGARTHDLTDYESAALTN